MNKELLQSIREKTSDINTVESYACRIEQGKKLWWRKFAYRVNIRLNNDHPEIGRYEAVSHIRGMTDAIENSSNNPVKTRLEYYNMQVYFVSDDQLNTFLEVIDHFNNRYTTLTSKPVYITELSYYPVEASEDGKKNIVVCNHLPFKKYRYKVTINPNEIGGIQEFCDYFLRQCKDGNEPFRFPDTWDSAIRRGRFWYGFKPYLYVEDDKQMSILGFYAAQAVHKIDEYRTKNELNINK